MGDGTAAPIVMGDGTADGTAARIVICVGSARYARELSAFLELDDDLRVAGTCNSGRALMGLLRSTHPDLVALELDLPRADSVALTREIVTGRLARVVLLAPHAQRGGGRALEGLVAGASDVLSRAAIDPSAPGGHGAQAVRLRIKRSALSRLRPLPTRAVVHEDGAIEVIGICASTGGPPALCAVLGRLPAAFPIPVLVVQHMTTGFTEGLAKWLDSAVAVPVALARAGAVLAPGVWFAPEGAHLVLNGERRLAIDTKTRAGAHRPSGDVLLSSLARVAATHAAAVVLTGMGSDGAAGLAAVAAAGGQTIAQDRDTSAVYGMPRVAAELGAARVLAPAAIGDALAAMALGLAA
jgi:two-component system, chemotaxis family, protein-glutamate methylesterase/glutaminase